MPRESCSWAISLVRIGGELWLSARRRGGGTLHKLSNASAPFHLHELRRRLPVCQDVDSVPTRFHLTRCGIRVSSPDDLGDRHIRDYHQVSTWLYLRSYIDVRRLRS